MADAYLELLIFAVVAMLVPALMLAFSKLVRPASDGNDVETGPYESAEGSVGRNSTVMGEYAQYFVLFLAFEVIGAVAILWSTFARQLGFAGNLRIELLLAFGFLMAMFVLALSRRGD
jgi:NADH:ubiquinone oxidoreductase subunit 3 (subunit A)